MNDIPIAKNPLPPGVKASPSAAGPAAPALTDSPAVQGPVHPAPPSDFSAPDLFPADPVPSGPAKIWEGRGVELWRGDCRGILPGLAAKSVSAWVTDPPYGQVVSEEWDRLNSGALLSLLREVSAAVVPLMRDQGTAALFCWPSAAGEIRGELCKRFLFLGDVVWCKRAPGGRHNTFAAKASTDQQRAPFPESERILFFEDPGKIRDGYADKSAELWSEIMEPLRAYFARAREASGLSGDEIRDRMAELTGRRYVFERHAFSTSQWKLPTAEQYAAAQQVLKSLSRPYEELRRQYEELRRPWRPCRKTLTDVWFYPPIPAGSPERVHPCQKPIDLMADLILTVTRPGDLILDTFAGSGSTGAAALLTGRRAVLIERDPRIAATAAEVLDRYSSLPVQSQYKARDAAAERGALL